MNNFVVCIVVYVLVMLWAFASATVQVSAVRAPLGEFESPTYLPHHRAFAREIEGVNHE